MAQLNNRIDTFVTLLLDVSGRARPTDLQGVQPDEAAELLRQYAAARPASGLRFEGDTLIAAPLGAVNPPAAPVDTTGFAAGAFDQPVAPQQPLTPEQPVATPSFAPDQPVMPVPSAGGGPATAGVAQAAPAPLPDHEAAMFEAAIPEAAPRFEAAPAAASADADVDGLGLPPLEEEPTPVAKRAPGTRPSPLLIVLLVILVLVAAAAAAYYLGAFEALGLL